MPGINHRRCCCGLICACPYTPEEEELAYVWVDCTDCIPSAYTITFSSVDISSGCVQVGANASAQIMGSLTLGSYTLPWWVGHNQWWYLNAGTVTVNYYDDCTDCSTTPTSLNASVELYFGQSMTGYWFLSVTVGSDVLPVGQTLALYIDTMVASTETCYRTIPSTNELTSFGPGTHWLLNMGGSAGRSDTATIVPCGENGIPPENPPPEIEPDEPGPEPGCDDCPTSSRTFLIDATSDDPDPACPCSAIAWDGLHFVQVQYVGRTGSVHRWESVVSYATCTRPPDLESYFRVLGYAEWDCTLEVWDFGFEVQLYDSGADQWNWYGTAEIYHMPGSAYGTKVPRGMANLDIDGVYCSTKGNSQVAAWVWTA